MSKYIDFVIEYRNGKKEITVVNSEGVSCEDVPTDKVIKRLMGDGIDIVDFAKTDQYYDEASKRSSSIEAENSDPFIQRREHRDKGSRQTVDL